MQATRGDSGAANGLRPGRRGRAAGLARRRRCSCSRARCGPDGSTRRSCCSAWHCAGVAWRAARWRAAVVPRWRRSPASPACAPATVWPSSSHAPLEGRDLLLTGVVDQMPQVSPEGVRFVLAVECLRQPLERAVPALVARLVWRWPTTTRRSRRCAPTCGPASAGGSRAAAAAARRHQPARLRRRAVAVRAGRSAPPATCAARSPDRGRRWPKHAGASGRAARQAVRDARSSPRGRSRAGRRAGRAVGRRPGARSSAPTGTCSATPAWPT